MLGHRPALRRVKCEQPDVSGLLDRLRLAVVERALEHRPQPRAVRRHRERLEATVVTAIRVGSWEDIVHLGVGPDEARPLGHEPVEHTPLSRHPEQRRSILLDHPKAAVLHLDDAFGINAVRITGDRLTVRGVENRLIAAHTIWPARERRARAARQRDGRADPHLAGRSSRARQRQLENLRCERGREQRPEFLAVDLGGAVRPAICRRPEPPAAIRRDTEIAHATERHGRTRAVALNECSHLDRRFRADRDGRDRQCPERRQRRRDPSHRSGHQKSPGVSLLARVTRAQNVRRSTFSAMNRVEPSANTTAAVPGCTE